MANNNRNQYNQDWDRNRGRFDQENDNNQNYDYDQGQKGRRNTFGSGSDYSSSSYGNQYGQQRDWDQDRNYNRNYGSEYGSGGMGYGSGWSGNRNDYDRRWGNTGSDYDNPYNTGSYGNRNIGRGYSNIDQGRGNRDWWDRTRDEVSSWFGDDDAERRRAADKRLAGEHRGKGPKGYTRSDDRIREDVHDRLADDAYVDASDIEVKVENGDVVLTGNVYSRDQKRRAEDIVEAISGVHNVENRIRVKQEHSSYANASQRSDSYSGYTGNTKDIGGIGRESGTTNEIIRNTGNMSTNK